MKRTHSQSTKHRRRLVLEQLERRELLTAADSSPIVEVELAFTDLDGDELVQPVVGEPFLLNAYVRDLRVDPRGVFAAYMDVTFDPDVLVATGSVNFDTLFSVARHGSLCGEDGILDEVGAASGSLQPIGGEWFRLFSLELTALNTSPTTITTNPADERVVHDVLVYGLDDAIPVELVVYGALQLEAMPAELNATVATSPNQARIREPEPSDSDMEAPLPIYAEPTLTWEPIADEEFGHYLEKVPTIVSLTADWGMMDLDWSPSQDQVWVLNSYRSYESAIQVDGETWDRWIDGWDKWIDLDYELAYSRYVPTNQAVALPRALFVTQDRLVMPEIASHNDPSGFASTIDATRFATLSAANVLVVEPQMVLTFRSDQSVSSGEALRRAAPTVVDVSERDLPGGVSDSYWVEDWDAAVLPPFERIPAVLADEVLTLVDDHSV